MQHKSGISPNFERKTPLFANILFGWYLKEHSCPLCGLAIFELGAEIFKFP